MPAFFALGAATWHLVNWTKRTHRLLFGLILSIIWKHDVIYKTGSTKRIALPSEESRAKATSNMYRKFGDIRTCAF